MSHKFAHHQRLTVVNDPDYEGQTVEVHALLDRRCETHNALCYGCSMGGDHISVCEEQLAPFNDAQKRKLN
jgi:hypothetical protein